VLTLDVGHWTLDSLCVLVSSCDANLEIVQLIAIDNILGALYI